MLLSELFMKDDEDILLEGARIAWAKVGDKVVKKYRCTSGARQGSIVSHPAQCTKPFDLKKRLKFRQTKLAKQKRMVRKTKRTKGRDPVSKRVRRMNLATRRR